jgi:hypothetical protein
MKITRQKARMKYYAPFLYTAQNGDLAPDGGNVKWGRTVARTRHCDCCPRTNLDDDNQRRLSAAWNATRHLPIHKLEKLIREEPDRTRAAQPAQKQGE